MSLFLSPPYITSYRELDNESGEWNFCVEAAYNDTGVFVYCREQSLDVLGMIMLLKMLANELGRQLESDN